MKKLLITLPLIFIFLVGGMIMYMNTKENKIKESDHNTPPTSIPQENIIDKELKEKLARLDNINKNLDYFDFNKIDRYLTYKEKNSELSNEDIVTRVNIGLDHSYYTNTTTSTYQNQIYILSNKYISLGEYVPKNLIKVSPNCSNGTRELVDTAKIAFEEMCTVAQKDGYTIRVMSAYRSYTYQTTLYQNYVKKDGVNKADTYSARPGFSEHQTGLVADIDNGKTTFTSFHKTKEYEWMNNNAYKYGWIERYPRGKENITGYTYESWHYRYVGVEIATYIKEKNITFDEYYVKYIENKK